MFGPLKPAKRVVSKFLYAQKMHRLTPWRHECWPRGRQPANTGQLSLPDLTRLFLKSNGITVRRRQATKCQGSGCHLIVRSCIEKFSIRHQSRISGVAGWYGSLWICLHSLIRNLSWLSAGRDIWLKEHTLRWSLAKSLLTGLAISFEEKGPEPTPGTSFTAWRFFSFSSIQFWRPSSIIICVLGLMTIS